uniref:biotin--[acetyl-CoA-carboxylase] ligase n=1 Tax=Eubacterium cellulosolvens TaxID=29322 RepID=UPI0004840661|nr:biotin--[acetyl-CoA-carboxylase] ligase [[Eubacterium] cellulosolvens]
MKDLLEPEKIKEALTAEGYEIRSLPEVDSTNEWAKREAKVEVIDGRVYLADYQSAGKGSRGRVWESPRGTTISMSVVLEPKVTPDKLSMITLVMGMAAADGIREVSGLDTKIKWPNDVVYNGKKLCGILTEMGAGFGFLVVGIGINVNVGGFPEELADRASSLYMETGRHFSRNAVAAAVLNYFRKYYSLFLANGDLTDLVDRYQDMLANKDQKVRVLDQKNPFEGIALGIDKTGELLVKREDDGQVEKVFAGEVSVRGIYGYV